MKKISLPLMIALIIGLVAVASVAQAKNVTIYRGKFDEVKLISKKEKLSGPEALDQPVTITEEKLHNMLAALRFDKISIIFKDRSDLRLFDARGLRLMVPYLVQAFEQATPEQMVYFLYIKKAPVAKVIRNDRLIIGTCYVRGGELFIRFTKLYAKIFGDYQRAGKGVRLMGDAKDVRVSLAQQPGQRVIGQKFVALEISHNFYADLQRQKLEDDQVKKEIKKKETVEGIPLPDSEPVADPSSLSHSDTMQNMVSGSTAASSGTGAALAGGAVGAGAAASASSTTAARLQTLEELKKNKLITKKEYKQKKAEILKDL